MGTQGRGLWLGAIAVATGAWTLAAAATVAEDAASDEPLAVTLASADTQVQVAGGEAEVRLHHLYFAAAGAPSGGDVVVAVPPGAAVEDVRLAVDGLERPVLARLALGEVRARVPHLPAGQPFTLSVAYVQPTPVAEDGSRSLRLPAPAQPSSDAPFTVSVVIHEALRSVESPTHRIVDAFTADGGSWVTLRDGAVPADRDFELRWRRAMVAENGGAEWPRH